MSEPNVFVEAFSEVIAPYAVPLADDDKISDALDRVDEVFASYHDASGEPRVVREWLEDTVYDFGAWLEGRTMYPDAQELRHIFPDSRVVEMYAALDVNAYTSEQGESLSGNPISVGAFEIASHLTRQILVLEHSVTIAFVSSYTDGVRVFEIPSGQDAFSTRYFGEPADNGSTGPWASGVYNAVLVAFLSCLASPVAALSVTSRIPDKPMGAFATAFGFVEGRFWPVSSSVITELVGNLGFGVGEPDSSFPAGQYEASAIEMANAIMETTANAFEAIFPGVSEGALTLSAAAFPGIGFVAGGHASVLYEEGAGGDTIVTPDGMVLIPSLHVDHAPLSKIFEDVHDSVIEGDADEGSRVVAAAALIRAACMYLTLPIDEARDALAAMLTDFGMFYELNSDAYEFNEDSLIPVVASSTALQRSRDDAVYKNLYDEMQDDGRKDDIDAIVSEVSAQSRYIKKVGVFEPVDQLADPYDSDVFAGQTTVSAYLLTAPPRDEDIIENLRTMCTRCSYSDKGITMFFALEDEQGHLSKLGAVQWAGGRWRNIDAQRIQEIVACTNIGQILNFQPDGNEDIIKFKKPVNGDAS